MVASDLAVVSSLVSWLQQGQKAWLGVVLSTWGSAPRPVGALFACSERGQTAGSLSGGCIEQELIEQLLDGQLNDPQVVQYGVSAEQQQRLRLPCGGRLEVAIEPVTNIHLEHWQAIEDCLQQGQMLQRQVVAQQVSWQPVTSIQLPTLLSAEAEGHGWVAGAWSHCLGPAFRLLLIGATDVARYLADMATAVDFDVVVCDPREGWLADFPLACLDDSSHWLPDDFLSGQAVDVCTAIVATSHDPRVDDMALMAALQSDAFYIGAMGSQRTSEKRRQRLLSLDLSAQQVQRLHAPIGLPIASKKPAEIAVSIVAHLIQQRALRLAQ